MKYFAKLGFIIMTLLLIAIASTSCMYGWTGRDVGFLPFFFGLPATIIGLAVYVLPIIIAVVRRSRSLVGIILVNILLGWTFIGWVVALVWSLVGEAQRR